MTDQIPTPDHEAMPLGTVLPFLDIEDVPGDWFALAGQTLSMSDEPDLVVKMNHQWSTRTGEWADMVREWWADHGGLVAFDHVVLPDIDPDEVFTMAFNTQTRPKDSTPVLAIKGARAVTSDASS